MFGSVFYGVPHRSAFYETTPQHLTEEAGGHVEPTKVVEQYVGCPLVAAFGQDGPVQRLAICNDVNVYVLDCQLQEKAVDHQE